MAVTKTTEVNKIVARCRRIGWEVETANGRQAWQYRINAPDGTRVQIHSSPSDRNWRAAVLRQLDSAGFTAAEQAWLDADEADRTARIEADRRDVEKKTTASAKKSAALDRAAGEYAVLPVDINWLLTPATLPQTRIVLMTPEAAAKVLATVNTANRHKRNRRTQFFVNVIEANDWGATHQGGAMDTNGVLQDSQHRLEAIVITGRTLPMMMSVGMPPENFRKLDTPMLRTARDSAQMRGEVNVQKLTTAARMILTIDRHGADAHVRRVHATVDTIDRAIDSMGDDLREAVRDAMRLRRETKANAAAAAVALYLIRRALPADDPRVATFVEQFETGVGIQKSHPVWLLRRFFIRASDTRATRMSAWEAAAMILKAWNHAASGRRTTQLVWRVNEGFPAEPFLPPPHGQPLPDNDGDQA